MASSFAQLFRKSLFARFNPKLPSIFCRNTPEEILPNSKLKFEAVPRPSQFGLKCEPPKTQFGKSIDFISVTSLDGDFGLPAFSDAKDRVLKRSLYEYLEKSLQTSAEGALPRVPGRILESCEGGFLIGIGPIRAHLAQSEIPPGISFNYYDMIDKKAYYFYLKSIQATAGSKSRNKSSTDESSDIFSLDHGHDSRTSKKQQLIYANVAQEQGFKVLLTLRKT